MYSYFNGAEQIRVNPLILYSQLMGHRVELSEAISQKKSVAKVIRKIFQLKEFEDGGLEDFSVLELLKHFMNYLELSRSNEHDE